MASEGNVADQRTPASERRERMGIQLSGAFGQVAPLLFLIALSLIFWALEPSFMSERNLLQVLRQVSFTGILAVGLTFVILTAGIDLSVGSLLAFCGIVAAAVAKGARGIESNTATDPGGSRVLLVFFAAIGVGIVAGALQGSLIAWTRVPAFVVTLGGLSAWRGATQVFSGGQPISGFSEDLRYWGREEFFGVPLPAFIFLLLVAISWAVLRFTTYGRSIYAVGGNPEAARLSGLNTPVLIFSVYVIAGFCAGLSAFLLNARLNSAQITAGQGYELDAIAAVVIGGTSLFGGEGRMTGTLIGVLLIGVINNGLSLRNVDPYYQPIVIGSIVVLSVMFDQFTKRRRRA